MRPLDPNQPIAVISDIHANITALEAVLEDIRSRGLEQIAVLGDLVGKGPNPAACVDAIQALDCPVIQGNWDERIAQQPNDWHRDALGEERLEYLRALPFSIDLEHPAGLVRLVHASPQGLWHRVGVSSVLAGELDLVVGMFESTELVGADRPMPRAVGYGDIHTAFVLNLPGHVPALEAVEHRTLFNVGSVGNPIDMPVPVYGVLGAGAGLEINLVRVPYDNELECRRAASSGMPQLEAYLYETRFARYRPRSFE